MYPTIQLYIAGIWRDAAEGGSQPVLNPATGEAIGTVPLAGPADLDAAVAAAVAGFAVWRETPALKRSDLLRKAAGLLRERADEIASVMTLEQGKRLSEARLEAQSAAEVIEWFAEEGRRAYGQLIPSRSPDVTQVAVREPVGPVAAFTPWNFPINQAVRKISAALAAGCSVVLKGPEETPGSVAALVRVFADAGLPEGVLNLVYGVPSEVSEHLIPHPAIRKISFTGSTSVGKHLASLAGRHMKRVTMELGGHAPALVFDDANLDLAVKLLSIQKFWNAGQACVSPSRFLVQQGVYDAFVAKFAAAAKGYTVGDGMAKETRMGPLANARRVDAMEALVADALEKGARLVTGGRRVAGGGFLFEPTVLADVPQTARIMNEEPFGPIAAIRPFATEAEAIGEANRLDYGLAAYAFTGSARTARTLGARIESGMVAINSITLALPELPFGGVKDSGYGSEGGEEAIGAYLTTKYISQAIA